MAEAVRRLRECFPFVGLQERWGESLWLFSRTMRGAGPGSCADGPLGECVATATDLSGGAPYAYDLLGLATGERYYARARWHNDLGFGAYELSAPEYERPAWNAPGAPPPVRLVNSSSVSLAGAWDHPTTDGGAGVMGYELWMDEWAGGRPRLVVDGTDQPDATAGGVNRHLV